MLTANNNYTVEGLVAKYRNFVKEHYPKNIDDLCEGKDGKLVEVLNPIPPYGDAGEQLLAILYKTVKGNNADPEIVNALSEYEAAFYKDAFTEEEFVFLCERYYDFVSYIFEHREEWNVIRNSLQHISKERMRLVKEYISPQEGDRVYIADTEYCDLAVQFPNCIIEGFTGWNYKQKEVWALGQIRMDAMGIDSRIVSGEEIDDEYIYTLPKAGSIDYVIFRANENKYFAQEIFGTECTDVEALYNLLKPGGKMLFFSEFKDELVGTDDFFNFRQKIVEEQAISSIVSYEDYSIVGNGKSSYIMLCLTKTLNHSVAIKNEKMSYTEVIPADQIESDILLPNYYMLKRPSDWISLSSIAELLPYERLSIYSKKEDFVIPEDAKEMLLVFPDVLADSYKDANLLDKSVNVVGDPAFNESEWMAFMVAKNPCILLCGNDVKLKLGYTTKVPDKGFAYSDCCGLIPRDGIDLRYLAALLLEPAVKEQILKLCDGFVSYHTLELVFDKVFIPNHNELERMAFLSEANYNALISSQEEMKKQHEEYKKSVRMRKHALTQSLSSMKAMFYSLNAFRVRQNGNISDNDKISRLKGTTVKEAFDFLDKNITDMMPAMEHIADVEYNFSKPEWIDPEKFIENYVAKYEKGWIDFKSIVTWEDGNNLAKTDIQDPATGEIIIKKGYPINLLWFPKDALERIFNNVVSNALAHGFTDKSRHDYQVRFSWRTDGLSLMIEIENNGTSIPADRDTTSLLEYGVSSALHRDGHNGIGCNEIDDIMHRYDGSVEIVSVPDENFTVKYILKFNRSNILRV